MTWAVKTKKGILVPVLQEPVLLVIVVVGLRDGGVPERGQARHDCVALTFPRTFLKVQGKRKQSRARDKRRNLSF